MRAPVAIVTGAGRGIGRAVAQELARLKHRLVLVARSREDLEETAAACGGGVVIPADVSKQDQVEAVVERALAELGRVDVLVNNAGFAPLKPIEQLTPDDWRAAIDTNLSSAYYFCRRLWPVWRGQGGGVVVNVSSQAARDPFPGFSAYGAAKAGLNVFGLAMAKEGAEIGVRVHTVAPSATETGMFRQILTREQYPTEKTLDPVDVARVIAQCASGVLKYTSGEVIYVHKTV